MIQPTPTAANFERWGGFVLAPEATAVVIARTPAAVDAGPDAESIPYNHPGYRQFSTIEEMAKFVRGRVLVLEPTFLPAGAVLLGAWVVELPDGKISDIDIGYRFADTRAPLEDADIQILSSYRFSQPLVYSTVPSTSSSGQHGGAPEKVTVR
ncbi:MAG: hypothetical protein KGJ86_13340, partial [Chloroflexota bacterium]|nr:hypothetical protein [Chloroflexota bacterium]